MKNLLNYLIGLLCVAYFVIMILLNVGVDFGSATETMYNIMVNAPPYLIGATALVNVVGKGVIRIVLFIAIVLCIILFSISQYTDLLSGLIK